METTTLTAREEWRRNWSTVLVAAFGMSATTLYLYSAGTFVGAIEADTGWSRAQIGSGITVVTIIAALTNPFVGAVIDRFGARRLAIAAITLFPAAFGAIALTSSDISSWWLHWAVLGLLGFAMTPSTWTAAVANLFDRSRGLALAVTMCGTGLGSIAIPLATTVLIEQFGWRIAFAGLGMIWFGIGLPLVLLLMRDGHHPRTKDDAATTRRVGPSARELLLSRHFLTLLCAVLFFTFVSMSFVVSIAPILISQDLDAKTAAAIASMLGVATIVGRLSTGYLLDRLEPRLVTAAAMTLPIFAALLFWTIPGSVVSATFGIILIGLALGAEIDGIAYLITRYFGVGNYAMLFGVTISASSVSTALAPLVSGRIYDVTGGYDMLLVILMFPCAVSALAILTLGAQPRPLAQSS